MSLTLTPHVKYPPNVIPNLIIFLAITFFFFNILCNKVLTVHVLGVFLSVFQIVCHSLTDGHSGQGQFG